MKDRNVEFPNRYRMVKVEGTDDIFDVIPAPGIVFEAGTLMNKLALLKDTTAALYNLSWRKVECASLRDMDEEALVYFQEDGKAVPFILSKKDYEADLNGTGRILVVRKNAINNIRFNATGVNAYAEGDLDLWLNGTYKALHTQEVQTAMGETAFYYTPGNGNANVTTLERALFALSATEYGFTNSTYNAEGTALPVSDALKNAYHDNGSVAYHWTRTPSIVDTTTAVFVTGVTTGGASVSSYLASAQPAFTLPDTFVPPVYWENTKTGEIVLTDPGEPVPDDVLAAIPGMIDSGNQSVLNAAAKIEVVSWVGTDGKGSEGALNLTFSFAPKLFIVLMKYRTASGAYEPVIDGGGTYAATNSVCVSALPTSYIAFPFGERASSSVDVYVKRSADGKTFSFYRDNNNAAHALNRSDYTFYGVAIG